MDLITRRRTLREKFFPTTRTMVSARLVRPDAAHQEATKPPAPPPPPPPPAPDDVWVREQLKKWPIPKVRTVRMMVIEAAALHGVTYEQVMSRSRLRPVAKARAFAVYTVWKEKGWSFSRIGEHFSLNHTTVMYHVHKLKDLEDAA